MFGIFAPDHDVARLTFFGLYALQHRGQESAGIAVADDGQVTVVKDMGLVSHAFHEQMLTGLTGYATPSATCATPPPAPPPGRTRSPSCAPATAARSPWVTTATS